MGGRMRLTPALLRPATVAVMRKLALLLPVVAVATVHKAAQAAGPTKVIGNVLAYTCSSGNQGATRTALLGLLHDMPPGACYATCCTHTKQLIKAHA